MMRKTSAVPLLLLLLVVAAPTPSSGEVAPLLNDEVLGLVVFKADLHDPTASLSSWSPDDQSPCSWSHVSCSPSGESFPIPLLALPSSASLSVPFLRALISSFALRSLSLGQPLSGPLPSPFPSLPRITSLSMSHLPLRAHSGVPLLILLHSPLPRPLLQLPLRPHSPFTL
ncbi:hypothetical protein HPP92_024331 [Vanilla planifolia]|uniref:Leucine-rich repeat-containing N-terminal plant-type domain-containing protein n=1 Tax=Vanilla planifolia TaxID=51239 RepID=A0A835PSL1_VANPL|nr:hypothetical protein HPP92_024331 [Vanilla planifolia]